MQNAIVKEAARQARICNACRYCEGYCDVFPALQTAPNLDEAELVTLANICHNCRGCYYACQYTAPHEFDLNFPLVLAQLRNQSWLDFSYPRGLARFFQNGGFAPIGTTIALFTVIIWAATSSRIGANFYSLMPHNFMVAIFMPLFLVPLAFLAYGLVRYWRALGGGTLSFAKFRRASWRAITLKNLSGGEAHGCNFEEGDRFSNARKWAHHLIFYGFLLCFLATSLGTILHYFAHDPAPYPLWSAPKVSGITGGIAMVIGGIWLIVLKTKADSNLSDSHTRRSEFAFITLLVIVAASGLALNGFGATSALRFWLAFHLASVATLFILTPYSKMAHGFYRLLAMMRE